MKRILITGADSYIGTSFESWLARYPGGYAADTIDMKNKYWESRDFRGYDSVFHVAGIAHADTGKVGEEVQRLYYRVNCDLAVETAVKARESGVGQFIYMSSIIVYGEGMAAGDRMITADTPPSPGSFYGDSKLQAEKKLEAMADEDFHVAILRPPMIYGRNSKGNYPVLAKIARKAPVFPYVDNQRSMLYIDSLCEFVRLMVENEETGTFYPQNDRYVRTSDMVGLIAQAHGRKMRMVRGMGWLVNLLKRTNGKAGKLANKAFGSLVYDMEMSGYREDYQVAGLEESVLRTEQEI